jgi:hypothetical protein
MRLLHPPLAAPGARFAVVTGGPSQGEPEPDAGVDPNGEAEPEPTDEGEDEVDEASEESFPASDAPASWSGPPDA